MKGEEMEKIWFFEGPEGNFIIPKSILPLNKVQLENLLTKCGFVVEWRDK
ncbi:hypothetical protein LCGC14_0831500 [marine sediment metagenome]|uniref:Uncharacterized protein n=1 Tax=marine sediment metagenome TaxID=412755 RepID=A0A0F9S0K0_9ZZZZ